MADAFVVTTSNKEYRTYFNEKKYKNPFLKAAVDVIKEHIDDEDFEVGPLFEVHLAKDDGNISKYVYVLTYTAMRRAGFPDVADEMRNYMLEERGVDIKNIEDLTQEFDVDEEDDEDTK